MSEHPNVQERLTTRLGVALGAGWVVRPYSWGPDGRESGRRYVACFRTEITRIVPGSSDQLATGTLAHVLTVDVITPHEDMARAEADLYAATDEVRQVIDYDPQLSGYTWTTAQRTVLGGDDDTFHAMRLSVWCLTVETETETE